MKKILILLLMMCIFPSLYAQQRGDSSQTSVSQKLVSPEKMEILTYSSIKTAKSDLEKMGYRSGKFSYGLYFYKNTQIKLKTISNDGATIPSMVNPKAGASLVMVYTYSDEPFKEYVCLVLNVSRSKHIADRWVADLKKMGYKSGPTESSTTHKKWQYFLPGNQENTFELIYFISTGEYLLERTRPK